jgi:hypothetical protein
MPKKRLSANPQDVVRHLAGLSSDISVGFLPVIVSNPKAARAFYDLRAIALRFLDTDFLAAIRPSHSDPARMLDAGIDAIGYAAFVQSRYREYPGIHDNLGALQEYLLHTPDPEIINYDLPVFLVTLRAAREALPALAAATTALDPVLTQDRIFRSSGRDLEYARLVRRLHAKRQQFAKFFAEPSDMNEVLAGFFPLLQQEPEETVFSYREMKERICATRATLLEAQPGGRHGHEARSPRNVRHASHLKRKKRRARPTLNYYRPASAAVTDRITRAEDFRVWSVPASIKELYEQHGRELAKARMSWLQYAKESWARKSTMRWVPSDEGGIIFGHLTQKVIDPLSNPPEMTLIEEALEEQETIVSILLDVSCSMQVDERYKLTYMIADRLGYFLTKGEVPTEIIGHTTTGEIIPDVIGRNRPIHYIVFKTRDEQHGLPTIHRLCSILHTGLHYFSYDGEATLWCHERLKKSRAKHRILLVVTDGNPSGTYLSKKGGDISYFTSRHFRDAVAFIEADETVDIVGLSIKADVSNIFSRSVRVDGIEDIYRKLSPFVLALLREANDAKTPPGDSRSETKLAAHRKARLAVRP